MKTYRIKTIVWVQDYNRGLSIIGHTPVFVNFFLTEMIEAHHELSIHVNFGKFESKLTSLLLFTFTKKW